MKRIAYLCIMPVVVMLIVSSCSSNKKETANHRLGKMDVEIPAELAGKPEVVEYITGMSQVADQYALMMDDMLEEVGAYAGMEESELGIMDKIKLTKATAEVAIRSTEIMGQWAVYQDKRTSLEEQLSEAELKALEGVWKRFEARIIQIESRHSEVFNQEKS